VSTSRRSLSTPSRADAATRRAHRSALDSLDRSGFGVAIYELAELWCVDADPEQIAI
jgi:hypothetical protein